jgi:hypothetical protein
MESFMPIDIKALEYDVISMHERVSKMNRPGGGGLELEFKVHELLVALKENRDEHEKIFNEAVEGFHKEYKEKLVQLVADAEEGKFYKRPQMNLTAPVNHLAEYNTAIRMLEMTTAQTITLTQEQFNCYVMDQWFFQHEFLLSNSLYSGTARQKVVGASR